MTNVYLLLGGVTGGYFGGYGTSPGMLTLASALRQLPGVTVQVYPWGQSDRAYADIMAAQGRAKIAIPCYSGGVWQATVIANKATKPVIDLLVAYDPSPPKLIQPIGPNVKQAICYYNSRPMMWWPGIGRLGGGKITGNTKITTYTIAEQHLWVQLDQTLHARTVAAIKTLGA